MKKTRIVAAVIAAGVMAAATVTSAQADPQGAPTLRTLPGMGSDTTQDVMNALSEVVKIGGVKQIASYDATGGGTVTPKAAANCQNLPRVNGSSAGRTALINALNPAHPTFGCWEWSRSSAINLASTPNQLTYVPFAYDNLGFAVTKGSNIPKDLTKEEIQSIYNCDIPGFKALIPQAGSGTRPAWLVYIGITEAQVAARPCISSTAPDGSQIQEHNGVALDNNSIVPYSVGKWLLQSTNTIPDVTAKSVLGKINGGLAGVPSPEFDGKRTVYNIIPTAKEGTAPISTVFVGSTSLVCTNVASITNSGFAQHPNCGSVADKTAP